LYFVNNSLFSILTIINNPIPKFNDYTLLSTGN
jgi:hypothetical protein